MANKWKSLYVENFQYDNITPPISGGSDLFTIVDVDVTAADLAAGGVKTLFTPAGSDVYLCLFAGIVTALSTDFSGGGGDRDLGITFGTGLEDWVQFSSGTLATASSLPVSVYTTGSITQNLPINSLIGDTITAQYVAGTTDFAMGSIHLRLYLLNTNATAIGGGDNIVYVKDVSITAAGLAAGGQVTILNNTDPAGQYEVITAYTSVFGSTNFSGGGGNRDLVRFTDGVSEYGYIESSTLAIIGVVPLFYGNSNVNGGIGIIQLPFSNSISVPSVAGANIYAEYTGGTTDFAVGDLRLSMVLRKIAGNNSVGVQEVVAGPGVSVDNTNPQKPIVSATGGGSGSDLFTIVDVDITAADLAGGAQMALFPSQLVDTYLIVNAAYIVDLSTDFDLGGDRDFSILSGASGSVVVVISPGGMQALSSSTANIQANSTVNWNLPTQLNEPVTAQCVNGSTDFVSGSIHIRMWLLNTNATAIGGADNIVYVKDVSITAAALAGAGQVTILNNTDPAGQYEVITAYGRISPGFSGATGRPIQITDGVSAYGNINTATLTNYDTDGISYGNADGFIYLPGANDISFPTAVGADLYAEYSGGVDDFAAGELKLSMVLRKIAGNNSVGVQEVVAGAGVSVDNTNPQRPIVSATGGGGGGSSDLFTIVDVDITAADLAGGATKVIWTPPDASVYLIAQCAVVVDQCVDFDIGGDKNIQIQFSPVDGELTQNIDTSLLPILSSLVPNLNFIDAGLDTNTINQQSNVIRAIYGTGTTDFVSGSLHLRYWILNTNATAIGGADNIVYVKDVSITAAALAGAGQVTILNNTDPAGQYEVITAYSSAFGSTNFSGGGGDRNVNITDGTGVYMIIDTSGMVSSSTVGFCLGNGIGMPDNYKIYQPTQPGANIYAEYSGGSFDYTVGNILFSMVLRKIAGNNSVGVQEVVAGPGVSVDNTNPQKPIVSAITPLVFQEFTITATDLAGSNVGNKFPLFTVPVNHVYYILTTNIVSNQCIDFSGGGGDRDLAIDNDFAGIEGLIAADIQSITTVYSNNTRLNSLSSFIPEGSQTTIYYNAGTADYTTGTISVRFYYFDQIFP